MNKIRVRGRSPYAFMYKQIRKQIRKNESTSRKKKTNLRHARERNSTEKYGKYVTIENYVTIESEKISEHVQLKKEILVSGNEAVPK